MKNGKYKYNRFYIESACKYTYNNRDLAHDPMLAATNFIKALDKIQNLIPQFKYEISQLEKDTAVMRKIVNTPQKKAGQLNRLKTELAALERKIQDTLKEIDDSESKDNTVNKEEEIILV